MDKMRLPRRVYKTLHAPFAQKNNHAWLTKRKSRVRNPKANNTAK